jgi:hypothetical protein
MRNVEEDAQLHDQLDRVVGTLVKLVRMSSMLPRPSVSELETNVFAILVT